MFADISNFSDVQLARLKYVPQLPPALQTPAAAAAVPGEVTSAKSSQDDKLLKTWFPSTTGQAIVSIVSRGGNKGNSAALRVGVLFAGRQCPGGHNVVAGLHDYLTGLNPASKVLGFISGTKGLFEKQFIEVTNETLSTYRNQVRCLYGMIIRCRFGVACSMCDGKLTSARVSNSNRFAIQRTSN